MKISRVVIKNFRSIKDLEFEPGDLCTLVGENNSGKSTIMRALNLVLGEFFPTERSFDESDFHNHNVANPITIQVYFDTPWNEEIAGNTVKISGFELTCRIYKRATKDKIPGEIGVDFVCIGSKGGHIPAERYRPGGPPPRPLNVNANRRARVPLLYVDVMREYARQRPSGRWSVLRRLVDQILASFNTDKGEVDVRLDDGTVQKMPRRKAFENLMERAYEVLKTDELADLESKIAANALEHLGMDAASDSVSIGFAAHDPANAYKNLELLIERLGVTSTAEEVGAGLQSAIVVAIFRTYEEMQRSGAIFAIEEPEAFLHPQKARYFAQVLERLSEAGNQVILTTHSPYFVKLHSPETVAAVRRTGTDGTKVVQVPASIIAPDLKAALKVQTAINAERGELLFARKAMLVEGDTERAALPFVLAALDVDPNKEGISIVECGGKGSIPFFSRIADSFSVPYVVLTDMDRGKSTEGVDAIAKICPHDRLFVMDPDFEGVSGYHPGKGNKVVEAHKRFSGMARDEIPAPIRDAVTTVLDL